MFLLMIDFDHTLIFEVINKNQLFEIFPSGTCTHDHWVATTA